MNDKSKIEIIARITTPDGRVIEESSVADDQIPDPDDFDLCSGEGAQRQTSVDSMLGRIGFHANGAPASALEPGERISGRFIRGLSLSLCTKTSCRNAASILNDVYFRGGPDAFIPQTPENKVDPGTGLPCAPEEMGEAIRMPLCPDDKDSVLIKSGIKIKHKNRGSPDYGLLLFRLVNRKFNNRPLHLFRLPWAAQSSAQISSLVRYR